MAEAALVAMVMLMLGRAVAEAEEAVLTAGLATTLILAAAVQVSLLSAL